MIQEWRLSCCSGAVNQTSKEVEHVIEPIDKFEDPSKKINYVYKLHSKEHNDKFDDLVDYVAMSVAAKQKQMVGAARVHFVIQQKEDFEIETDNPTVAEITHTPVK